MRASWVTLPAGLVVASLSAVSVGQSGCSNTSNKFVEQQDFAAEYAQALCSSLQHCCAENGVSQDYTSCTQGWQAAVQSLLDSPAAAGNYDVTTATNCIDEVRAAQGVSCQPVPGSLSAARPTCQAVFAGEVPLGAPCSAASQCAQVDSGVVTCAVVPGDGGGGGSGGGQLPLSDPGISIQGLTVAPQDIPVCVLLPPSDAGPGPCAIQADAGTDTCQSQGAYCDPTTLTCLPVNSAGGLCDPAVPASCAPGSFCVSGGAANGTCAMAGPVGSACTSAAMCAPPGVCDIAKTQTCIPVENPGAQCGANFQCSIGVCDPPGSPDGMCLTNAIATTAACNGNVSQ